MSYKYNGSVDDISDDVYNIYNATGEIEACCSNYEDGYDPSDEITIILNAVENLSKADKDLREENIQQAEKIKNMSDNMIELFQTVKDLRKKLHEYEIEE